MRLFKSTLTLHTASATHWQADTVFGHLCWSLLRRSGETTLAEFLSLYEEKTPPVLLSDGFPGDYLPRPLLPPPVAPAAGESKRQRIERLRLAKKLQQVELLTLDEFNRARMGQPVEPSLTQETLKESLHIHAMQKNQIDRVTNTAGSEAGELYNIVEYRIPRVTIFWRIAEGYFDTVSEFLNDLQATGYGKRKSVGYGQVEGFTLKEFNGFTDVPEANGFVTLSRFVPEPDDPTDGYWNATVKYGKLGEELAVSGNPYKRPLVQLVPGSCFRDATPREWYGRLLGGLSQLPEVKHYGFAFPVPMFLPEN
jgi:CRISPR-associated protein Csm4